MTIYKSMDKEKARAIRKARYQKMKESPEYKKAQEKLKAQRKAYYEKQKAEMKARREKEKRAREKTKLLERALRMARAFSLSIDL